MRPRGLGSTHFWGHGAYTLAQKGEKAQLRDQGANRWGGWPREPRPSTDRKGTWGFRCRPTHVATIILEPAKITHFGC